MRILRTVIFRMWFCHSPLGQQLSPCFKNFFCTLFGNISRTTQEWFIIVCQENRRDISAKATWKASRKSGKAETQFISISAQSYKARCFYTQKWSWFALKEFFKSWRSSWKCIKFQAGQALVQFHLSQMSDSALKHCLLALPNNSSFSFLLSNLLTAVQGGAEAT